MNAADVHRVLSLARLRGEGAAEGWVGSSSTRSSKPEAEPPTTPPLSS